MQSGSAAHVHHEHQADMTAIAWPWGTSLRYPHNLIWHCNCLLSAMRTCSQFIPRLPNPCAVQSSSPLYKIRAE